MRSMFSFAFLAAAACVAVLGCSTGKKATTGAGGDGGGGGDGGSGGTTKTTTTTTTKTSAGDCTGTLPASTCNECVEGACCHEITACSADDECATCLDGTGTAEICNANEQFIAINTCAGESCSEECMQAACNPVTNEGCDTAGGSACDLSQTGYVCFAPPNDVDLCGTCSNANGPFCKPGMHCIEAGTCAKYCCDDGDCGTGTCDKTVLGDPNIGLCLDAAGASACDAPLVSPSMGTCAGM